MKSTTASALASVLLAIDYVSALPPVKRDVDTRYPYKGPDVPIADWVDNTVNGNGKGFPRLVEPPAVTPSSNSVTNNVNVIQLSYLPGGVNIHYQTPFGLDSDPTVMYGTSNSSMKTMAKGKTTTFDRTPPCSAVTAIMQCSQYFHDVQITGLKAGTTYSYMIPASNGTTASDTLTFTTARAAGDKTPFTVAVLNDMGYTNAIGTHKYLAREADNGAAFAWHGGDISYADDWFSGILPCTSDWPVCYNGSETHLPGGKPFPSQYLDAPLPAGEVPNQGGPQGGDMNVLYESNWDLWQNWMNAVTMKIPYMTTPGNHEAACAEFDSSSGILSSYLNKNMPNSTGKDDLTYYSCPPSQRNFTRYQHSFRMPGEETGGRTNFWYSFDYGLGHFISLTSETDYPDSAEASFLAETGGKTDKPKISETYVTDSGPFGYIKGDYMDNDSYEQIAWLKNDLKKVDRSKTPWVIAMAHRPMYSSQKSSYQRHLRNAFEKIMIDGGVDMYLAGHIHWYERMHPLTADGKVDNKAIMSKNAYQTNEGTSMVHVVNGQAGNIESHSTLGGDKLLDITALLNKKDYGFSKIMFESATKLTFQFIMGKNGKVGDEFTLTRKEKS